MDADDDDDDTDEREGVKKEDSEELLEILTEVRAGMVKDRVKYEDSYYTEKLTPDDDKLMKLYLMTIGPPGKTGALHPVKKKVLTAYIGSSFSPTHSRIHRHNNLGVTHHNPRTKTGASRWTLCMVLFIPNALLARLSAKLIKMYWGAAHGRGKIKRGIVLQRMFGLACYVPDEVKKIVAEQTPAPKMLMFSKHSFMADGIVNINDDLIV